MLSETKKRDESSGKSDNRRKTTVEELITALDASSGVKHTLKKRLPCKIFLIEDNGLEWARVLQRLKGEEGMGYIFGTDAGERMAVLTSDGGLFASPSGKYKNEKPWHVLKSNKGLVVVEEIDDIEAGVGAEITWRSRWEEYKAKLVEAYVQREVLKRLLGEDCDVDTEDTDGGH